MGKIKVTLLVIILFSILTPKIAYSESISEQEINKLSQEIGEETMSPFCPGRTLQACPSEDARQLKSQISSLLSMGYSKDAVRRRLLTMYGEQISGLPANNSFKDIAWLSPLLFGLIGMIIVYFGLRLMKKGPNMASLEPEGKIKNTNFNLSEIEQRLRK